VGYVNYSADEEKVFAVGNFGIDALDGQKGRREQEGAGSLLK